MLNEPIKIEKKEKAEFEPLPEKIYQVEVFDINAKQKATYDTRNKPDEQKIYETILDFQFTLLNGKDKDGKSLRGRNLWENFVPTYLYIGKNGKNKLYQITESCLGRELTQEEEATMDKDFLNKLIGSQIQVVVKNQTKGDKIYNRIDSFVSADSQLEKLTDEEREKVMVKKKEETPDVNPGLAPVDEEININDVPF